MADHELYCYYANTEEKAGYLSRMLNCLENDAESHIVLLAIVGGLVQTAERPLQTEGIVEQNDPQSFFCLHLYNAPRLTLFAQRRRIVQTDKGTEWGFAGRSESPPKHRLKA